MVLVHSLFLICLNKIYDFGLQVLFEKIFRSGKYLTSDARDAGRTLVPGTVRVWPKF